MVSASRGVVLSAAVEAGEWLEGLGSGCASDDFFAFGSLSSGIDYSIERTVVRNSAVAIDLDVSDLEWSGAATPDLQPSGSEVTHGYALSVGCDVALEMDVDVKTSEKFADPSPVATIQQADTAENAYIELTQFEIYEEPLDGDELNSAEFARVWVTVHGGRGEDIIMSVVNGGGHTFSFGRLGDAHDLVYTGPGLDETVIITINVWTLDKSGHPLEAFFDLTIHPRDVDLAPRVFITETFSVAEENTTDQLAARFEAEDLDQADGLLFTLSGEGSENFKIVGDGIYLKDKVDFEMHPSYSLTLTVTDKHGKSHSADVNISISNVNEAPSNLLLSGSRIDENSANGAVIGVFSAIDSDFNESFSFALKDNGDGPFKIVGNELRLTGAIDHEKIESYQITVLVTDKVGNTFQKSFTIMVDDRNDAPSLVVDGGAVDADAEVGTVVATLSASDQDGDDVSFRLTTNPGGLFRIVDGEIVLAKRMTEAVDGTVEITVEASDGRGGVTTETITVEIDKSVQSGDGKDNTLVGDAGRNVFFGKGGDDDLQGLAGNDKLVGDGGDDVLEGGLGGDAMIGGAGQDTASYAAATAGVMANLARQNATTGEAAGDSYKGIENLAGSAFDDHLTGDGRANRLAGADGDDSLEGGGGDDALTGGDGLDELTGGTGRDKLSGGLGPDSFVWKEQREAGDVVLDFVSDGDLLVFAVDGWKGMKDGGFKLVQSDDPKASGGKQTFLFDRDNGKLWFDADGSGDGDAVFIATLRDVDKLKASDFDLV